MTNKKPTEEQNRAIFCVVNGHTNIIETCFGYVNCARCNQQIGDSLAGIYSNELAVIVGHACNTCKANYQKLTAKDKKLVPKEILSKLKAELTKRL